MKMLKAAAAAMAGAAALACAGAASATVYNLNVYDNSAGFTGNLGTVTVTGQGTSTLSFDVVLSQNVFFQLTGNSSPQNPNDAFWFDLNKIVSGDEHSFHGGVNTNITSPNAPGGASGGDYPTGGLFAAGTNLGHGWSDGDYGLTVSDSSRNHGGLDYYGGELTFTVSSKDGSLLTLDDSSYNNTTVYGGADLRQCDARGDNCKTGPVGFSLAEQTSAVPEPAVWAMMLVGFGGLGAMLRYRRRDAAAA